MIQARRMPLWALLPLLLAGCMMNFVKKYAYQPVQNLNIQGPPLSKTGQGTVLEKDGLRIFFSGAVGGEGKMSVALDIQNIGSQPWAYNMSSSKMTRPSGEVISPSEFVFIKPEGGYLPIDEPTRQRLELRPGDTKKILIEFNTKEDPAKFILHMGGIKNQVTGENLSLDIQYELAYRYPV